MASEFAPPPFPDPSPKESPYPITIDQAEYNSLLLALGFAVGLLVKHDIPLEPEITTYLERRGYVVDRK